MNKPLRPSDSLFRFRYSHLPDVAPKDDDPRWIFKTFGFFDALSVDSPAPEHKDVSAAGSEYLAGSAHTSNAERHQRILHAYGNRDRVAELLNETVLNPCYLAVSLLKLTSNAGHGAYDDSLREVLSLQGTKEVYLGCLDAPDLIVMALFGQSKAAISGEKPLKAMMDWVEKFRGVEPLRGKVERTLTMVSCKSLPRFIHPLAEKDKGSGVRALVRVVDTSCGAGLRELRKHVASADMQAILEGEELLTSVGYYDLQGVFTIPQAAAILRIAYEALHEGKLTTSTGILGDPDLCDLGEPPEPWNKPLLLISLEKIWPELQLEFSKLEEKGCLNLVAQQVAAEMYNRFERLSHSGLMPGSRQLLWTARDSMRNFAAECRDHLEQRAKVTPTAALKLDASFHDRQTKITSFHRTICDELDRRVSLSLPAHTRFFPCAIEAPLKVVGALDLVSRLVTASFRSYRCLQDTGLLQVFTTSGEKPSEFFDVRRQRASTGPSFPTMVTTHFNPRMVQHFYLALFTVFHEVAQSIVKEVITWPSFTGLIFSQAFVERLGIISSLVCFEDREPKPRSVQPFMHDWCRDFLTTELGVQTLLKAQKKDWEEDNSENSEHLVNPDVDLTKHPAPSEDWMIEDVWQSQIEAWEPKRISTGCEKPRRAYFKLKRDSGFCILMGRQASDDSFVRIWAQELSGSFGERALAPDLPDGGLRGETRSPLPQRLRSSSDEYEDQIGPYIRRIDDWTKACDWVEYLELASLLPFLRLFEGENEVSTFAAVVAHLARDYCDVWQDSESREGAHNAARRFALAIAALDVFQRQRGIGDLGSCMGRSADEEMMSAINRAAGILLQQFDIDPPRRNGRAKAICRNVWGRLAGKAMEPDGPEVRFAEIFAQPIIVTGLVRFLVRLLHVYRADGGNVEPGKTKYLEWVDRYLLKIFVTGATEPNHHIPVRCISELWASQYQLTDMRETIDYLFELKEAHGLLRIGKPDQNPA